MIALLAAALINLFTLAAPLPDTKPSFDLHGYSIVSGQKVVTNAAPSLAFEDNSDAVEVSFSSPVTGNCVALQVATKDGHEAFIQIGGGQVNKLATVMLTMPLYSQAEVEYNGGEIDGYNVVVVCADTKNPKAKPIYSNVYHYTPHANAPA